MAPLFVIPCSGIGQLEDYSDDRLFVLSYIDVSKLAPNEVEELAKEVAFELGDKDVTCIEEQAIFDQLYSLVKNFVGLQPSTKRLVLEVLCSNLTVLIPSLSTLKNRTDDAVFLQQQVLSYRNALKIYSCFLQHIYVAEDLELESQKGKSLLPPNKSKQGRKKHVSLAWNWDEFRIRILGVFGRALEADLRQLYGDAQPEESLMSFYVKFGLKMLESPVLLKDKDAKGPLAKYFAACATKYGYHEQLVSSLVDQLYKYELLPVPLAEIVTTSTEAYNDNTLAVGILREIGLTDSTEYTRLTTVADNVKSFLVELADRMPRIMAANLSMLVPHFAGDSYKIRNALVTVLGKLIAKAFGECDSSISENVRLRNKQAMLDLLLERARDSNAHTRSCVLQTWSYLCEQSALSIGLWNQVVDIATGRLLDKAVLVRKSALQLLTTLLQYNPFGPQLRTGTFEATLQKYKTQLEEMTTGSCGTVEDVSASAEAKIPVTESRDTDPFQHPFDDSCPSQSQEFDFVQHKSDVGGLEQTRAVVASLEAAVHFSKAVASTMPILAQLLSSPAVFDVQQTIHFLTDCRKFSIDGSEDCLRKMLPLVFSQEKSICEAVESAFLTTYLKKSPQETALNLVKLTTEAPVGDLAAVEALIVSLTTKGEISTSTVSALWDVFTFNAIGVTSEQCRGALSLLCMIAKACPNIMSSRLQNVVDIGFGRWAKEDMLLARFSCIALQRVSKEDKWSLQSGHKVFTVLSSLIMGTRLPDGSWYSATEQAINAIYALHPTPETFMASVLQRLLKLTFDGSDGEQVVDDPHEKICSTTVSSSALSRFFFTVGHCALKHLIYIESCMRTIRKQRADKERSAAESASDISLSAAGAQTETQEENINAELGMAATEDLKLDLLFEKVESEIISGIKSRKLFINRVAPLVAKICRNSTLLQQFPRLRSSAILCLCKFMVIDAHYCEENLQLLFTIAQNCPDEAVRSNCVICLGDITFRFPNVLEPWTEHAYGRLHDKSENVRKNAVLVIAHLILNDMMKVKGHISEMALRIEDENARISDLAKLFFQELSKKGSNPIYNLLPEILSRLSNSPNVSRESFHNVMQFLIGFIKKDKQMEGMIEKLCHRLSSASDRMQWQTFAYCLSQLTYSEKAMKKLVESLKQFENALIDERVVEHFQTICTKAKKLAKQDFRHFVEDFEENVISIHQQKKEEEEQFARTESKAETNFEDTPSSPSSSSPSSSSSSSASASASASASPSPSPSPSPSSSSAAASASASASATSSSSLLVEDTSEEVVDCQQEESQV